MCGQSSDVLCSSLTGSHGGFQSCTLEATKSGAKDLFGSPLEGAAASALEDSELEPTIWVCLQCGHQVGLASWLACLLGFYACLAVKIVFDCC